MRAALAGLLGLAIVWPCMSLLSNFGSLIQQSFGGSATPDVAHFTLAMLREHAREPAAWAICVVVVFISPLAEEVVWRGAVQQALKYLRLPRMAAVAITAVMFAMVHWSAIPETARISALPALAALGFALGWLMERCGRIAAPFAAHAAFNAANLLLFSMLP